MSEREIEVPRDCSVMVGKLDPPRFQRFEKSGGLPLKMGCTDKGHVWLYVGKLKDGTPCVCGKATYRAESVTHSDSRNGDTSNG